MSDHITFKDNVFHCAKCGAKKTLKIPMTVQDFTLKSRQFINEHKDCANEKKPN